MVFATYIHGTRKMNSNDFDDPLTFFSCQLEIDIFGCVISGQLFD